jgi:hypothetical protein
VPRRTNVNILVDTLQNYPKEQASKRSLAAELGWDIDKLTRVIEQAKDDSTRPVETGPNGVVRYRGSERGKQVGLYYDVARVIERYWAGQQGLRDPHVTRTARSGKRKLGVWSHPDLVLQALPQRRRHRDDPPDIHSIEVETYSGFDIRSVYQAHAQGRGADYRWVFFATAPKVNPPLDRIMWAAEELGIGLVEFDRAGASTTYSLLLDADRAEPTSDDRQVFCENVGIGLE